MDENSLKLLIFFVEVKNSLRQLMEKYGHGAQIDDYLFPFAICRLP